MRQIAGFVLLPVCTTTSTTVSTPTVATATYTDGNARSASTMAAAVSPTVNSSLAMTARVVGRTHSTLSSVATP